MTTQLTIFELAPPKNQLSCVLKMLIERNGVAEKDTPFLGFRSRISDLRLDHNLNIRTVQKDFTNQFGRPSKYNVHYLMDGEKDQARLLYEKLNQ